MLPGGCDGSGGTWAADGAADQRMGILPSTVGAVVFDVGETIVDETRHWTELARACGLTPFTLMAAIGATIEAADLYPDVVVTLSG